ncbi:MAG: PilZ domain-containing protein [Planctomycetes bacterium]|nr:PilZ domain-containing protein [Planctomycetota bacterium]
MENKRKHRRVAPAEFTLVLKPMGLLGLLRPNVAVQWLDVSEGGIGVIVSQPVKVGARLRARLANPSYRDVFNVEVEVRHIRECQSKPGYWLIGCQFINPSPVMRTCIRSLVDNGHLPLSRILLGLARAG